MPAYVSEKSDREIDIENQVDILHFEEGLNDHFLNSATMSTNSAAKVPVKARLRGDIVRGCSFAVHQCLTEVAREAASHWELFAVAATLYNDVGVPIRLSGIQTSARARIVFSSIDAIADVVLICDILLRCGSHYSIDGDIEYNDH